MVGGSSGYGAIPGKMGGFGTKSQAAYSDI
jgi:hypothetical protein